MKRENLYTVLWTISFVWSIAALAHAAYYAWSEQYARSSMWGCQAVYFDRLADHWTMKLEVLKNRLKARQKAKRIRGGK